MIVLQIEKTYCKCVCVCVCRKMLKICGETQDRLAQELLLFELQTEHDVIEPLYTLAEVCVCVNAVILSMSNLQIK